MFERNDASTDGPLPPLAEADRHRVLVEWNDTGKDYPIDQCLHQLVEQQVERTPEAVALVFGGETLTYHELNRRANQLAHHLRVLGVEAGSLVGVCAERSFEMVIGLLGTLKAGGAYVPLDPEYPKDRLAFMIQDANVPVLLTQRHLVTSLPTHGARVICLDADWDLIARASADNPPCFTRPDQLAYMIYTSGSTGKPKGAMNHHRGICNRLLWMQDEYRLSGADRVMQKTPFSFDVSVWEFFWPLLTGARLVVVRPGGHRDPAYLANLIEEQKITVLHFVPSMLQIFLEESGLERCGSLRHVICSGEALPYELQEKFFAQLPAELHNLYGPTEAAVDVTYWKCQRGSTRRVVPIGRPVANTQCYILDLNLQPVPVGEVGELHLAGVQIGYGYHNRPELTAEKFIPDPFRSEPGARLYRTGDLARYLSDGSIEYLGRIDHQVKIRGFRIELGEIESCLRKHPGVRDCVVVARGDQPGQQRLVAYLVPSNGKAQSVQELRAFLQRELPDYMVPVAFVMLDVLPLSPNGKIDRKALPAPEQTRPALSEAYVAPRTPEESVLAEIWSQVLEVQPVGVHDNYFELGGDSIRVIQMLARARQKGLHLTLEQVYKEQTIERLVPHIRSTPIKSSTGSDLRPFELVAAEDRRTLPAELEDAYPLVALQAGMHFHCEVKPESAVFHDIFSFAIFAAFDQAKLKMSLHQLVTRHAALRTSFDFENYAEPLQLVHKEARVPFTLEDLRHLTPDKQKEALLAWFAAEKNRPFQWQEAPLVRFHVQVYGEQQFQFMVSFHHIIFDGWSLAALLTQLFQDYFSMLNAARPTVSPLRTCYREYVALEKKAASSEEHRRFWTEKLADPALSTVPRWPKSMCKGGAEQVRGPEIIVPTNVFEGLKKLAQTAGVPLRAVLHAAHLKVMSVVYGKSDVLSGLATNGRQEELDAEQMAGVFLNSLPFRMKLTGGSWLELCRQTFAAEREIIPYRRLPLIEAQKLAGGQSLFETLFDFVNFHVFRGLEGYPNCRFEEGHYFEANNFTLVSTFMLNSTSTVLEFHFDYDPAQLPEEQIREFCGYYLNTLAAMASDPTARYESFSPLSETEKRTLLVDWNHTATDYPRDRTINDLFETQAARSPHAVAVEYEGRQLTYGELNARANQVAHYLARHGVGPEVMVGICVERSLEMVVGILGILKAGGAYVPLDPDYPAPRLTFMLEDTAAPVLLTQAKLRDRLPACEGRVVSLDADWPEIARERQDEPNVQVSARNLAYVIYTSGSTGRPKGTCIEHRSVVRLVKATNYVELGPQEVFLQYAPISFDASTLELWGSLLNGAKLVVCPAGLLSLEELGRVIRERKVTTLWLTAALFHQMVDEQIESLRGVRQLLAGGETLSVSHVRRMLEVIGNNRLINGYGPTENTTFTCCHVMTAESRIEQTVPIGRPISNTRVYVLDGHMQLVPVGVYGELYIAGDGLAREYLHQPQLTAEKFVSDPFSSDPEASLYRSGDLVRFLGDGNIEFLGRIDNQVKIRGYRIELGEIEAVLAEHPDVRQAVVHLWTVQADDVRLVACCVPAKAGVLAPIKLRKHLRARLPEYMVPQYFLPVEEIPLTPNGKVDRSKLATPAVTEGRFRRDEAPADPVEAMIAEIWTNLIGPSRPIGRADKFFEMGGHSLLALRALRQMEHQLGVKLDFRALFQESLADIATRCRSQRTAQGGGEGGAARPLALQADTELKDRVI